MSSSEIKIQFRCTEEEKRRFRQAATDCGYRSLSEWLRVAAFEYVRRHLGEQELRDED